MDDLDHAIMTIEQVVDSTPVNHPDRAGSLNNLCIVLWRRFKRIGSMDDLDHAIMTIEQAIDSTPIDHPDRATWFINLGNTLWGRFERTGSMDDLDRAIVANEQAVESSPVDHPDHAGSLNNLGIALQSRFERTGSMDDLDRAIVTNEQAVNSTPVDHPNHAASLNNLVTALGRRFEKTGSMDDLDHAIMTIEQVVDSIPINHPDRAGPLNNLGVALRTRFDSTGSMDDLDHAIVTNEQAINSIPVHHPDRASMLNNLGVALHSRFERTGSMDDLDRAIVTHEQAFNSITAPPSVRINAASSCSDLLISQKSHSRAKSILEAAVQLLPTVSPRHLKRGDQQFNISRFSNITSRAVSLQRADADDLYKSLKSLELGRGIIANLQLEVRSDISVLEVSYPDLAQQFQDLRDQIDPPSRTSESLLTDDLWTTSDSISILDSSKSSATRHALLKRFDDLLQHIRSLQGFENFLQGPSESELHSLAEEGPIVIFNVSDIRSDAFLITIDKIRSVHLPLLTSHSVEDYVNRFLDAIIEDPRQYKRVKKMNGVLEWLWDSAVKPILEELGFTRMPSDKAWPRVWWIGGGKLNILPIHASGYHDATPPQTALDRVISSYAPTVKSLAYARERVIKVHHVTSTEKTLLIAMPETLPSVKTEIDDLKMLMTKASIDITVMQNPRRTEALLELPKYAIVHFACHGYAESDPSQSYLLLKESLTVSDLVSLNIKSGRFAYLSACHTSAMRNFHLLDESISLSSAIQLSGYPSVVGSLWQVIDRHSADVARDVYTWILEEKGELNVRRSAEGLHKAVRDLRDRTRFSTKSDPLVWASFIHVGV